MLLNQLVALGAELQEGFGLTIKALAFMAIESGFS
jgi:hypothetical protein